MQKCCILAQTRVLLATLLPRFFFALKSEKRDGHDFLEMAYAQGVRQFVVSNEEYLNYWLDANVYLVENTLAALQKLGKYARNQFEGTVIGITGSNGKTVVKEWLFQALSRSKRVVRSPRSYNSQIGVPLSLWLLQSPAEIALIEAGISKKKEMAALESMIQPDIGVFTHFGSAHDEGFECRSEKLAEKMRLFNHTSILVLGINDQQVRKLAKKWKEANQHRRLMRWSDEVENAEVFVVSCLRQISTTTLQLNITTLTQGRQNLTLNHTFYR